MTIKLLIDECLSPGLKTLAHDAGFEATAVRDRGWLGLKDHELMAHVLKEDFTLVTRNSRDFRGPFGRGEGGLHRAQELHCGLICVNSDHSLTIPRQTRLFTMVLKRLTDYESLVNTALEIFEDELGNVVFEVYEIPEH